jgi:hypothetical protein
MVEEYKGILIPNRLKSEKLVKIFVMERAKSDQMTPEVRAMGDMRVGIIFKTKPYQLQVSIIIL